MVLDQRTMLLASLPPHGPLFAAKQTPLSRLKLDERLALLEETEGKLLGEIEAVLQWDRFPIRLTDREITRRAHDLVSRLENEKLREIVRWRLDMRTVMAALRRRHRGESAPPRGEPWGYGRFVDHIARHWSEPAFRLERALPWIPDADRLLREGDSLGLERLLLGAVWDELGRASDGHFFDFEAIVIYVLRWNVVARWTSYDGEAAAQRFQGLVESGLGEFASLFD